MVEVEVGPFNDFAQLTLFEDAAAGIDGASEITVKRFSAGRATVSMNLENPIDLLRELEERAPFDFVVRDTRRDGLVLDVDEDAPSRTARRSDLPARFRHTSLSFSAPSVRPAWRTYVRDESESSRHDRRDGHCTGGCASRCGCLQAALRTFALRLGVWDRCAAVPRSVQERQKERRGPGREPREQLAQHRTATSATSTRPTRSIWSPPIATSSARTISCHSTGSITARVAFSFASRRPRMAQKAAIHYAADYELAGAVAQLGRALRWHRRGRGFESHQLHSPDPPSHQVGAH